MKINTATFGAILLILFVSSSTFAQNGAVGLLLTANHVKERVAHSYREHQRLTVKIRSSTQNGHSIHERSISGSIQAINTDNFTLRRDDLFGGHQDLTIAYAEVLSLKRQYQFERVAKVIGNNAAAAPIIPLYALCILLGARG